MRPIAALVVCVPLLFVRPAAAQRAIAIDRQGVLRWRDDGGEVALFGANYTLPSSTDYRAAGYLHLARKQLVDEDMAHFARMGWDALRLSFWGDWESSDTLGNLLPNEHLDLLDYVIARARERGIYMLLSPITTYDAGWPDSLQKRFPGFSRKYDRGQLGTNPAAIAAEANYLRQILNHVNPYTGVALKDDPWIPFVELINEPWHHPEDFAGSVRYINALADAVRATGSKQILFYNVSQDFAIARAIRASKVQGVTFGWYPSGLNSGHELRGNFLRAVDDYPPMRAADLAGLPRVVYEFDTADLRTGYMYPAMARTFRSVGAQFATMFSYDMLGTASRNLGWQTHYLNLVYTPRKAMSAVIAAEVMRRLPAGRSFGPYPFNTRFGDFRLSYDDNLAELVADDAYMNAGATTTRPPHPERLRRIAGFGPSPIVGYEGLGSYFLDRVKPGVWRLEVYPDAVPVSDPFVRPSPDRIVTRAVWRERAMRITLPDLGGAFTIEPLAAGRVREARHGAFTVTPGVYVLSARGPIDRGRLPARWGRLGFAEFHAPADGPAPSSMDRDPEPCAAGTRPRAPEVTLFDPARDAPCLAFTRIGDAGRRGLFRLVPSSRAGAPAFHFELPVSNGWSPADYTASLFVGDRVASFRGPDSAAAISLGIRGLGASRVVHVTLVERDGTSWSAAVSADSMWSDRAIPLSAFALSRGVLLPEGFPGEWNYWVGPAAGRGGPGDHVRLDRVERLQLSLRKEDVGRSAARPYGVEIEFLSLVSRR